MKAYRRNGVVVLEVTEDALVSGAGLKSEPVRVTDRERFLDHVTNALTTHTSGADEEPALNRLLDAIVTDAAECDAGAEFDEEG